MIPDAASTTSRALMLLVSSTCASSAALRGAALRLESRSSRSCRSYRGGQERKV